MNKNKVIMEKNSFAGHKRQEQTVGEIIVSVLLMIVGLIIFGLAIKYGSEKQTVKDCYTASRHQQEFGITPPDNLLKECNRIGIFVGVAR